MMVQLQHDAARSVCQKMREWQLLLFAQHAQVQVLHVPGGHVDWIGDVQGDVFDVHGIPHFTPCIAPVTQRTRTSYTIAEPATTAAATRKKLIGVTFSNCSPIAPAAKLPKALVR